MYRYFLDNQVIFEIAGNNMYSEPAWGVTANILFKTFPGMSFDTRYAKTGGGEDVDFALRTSQENGNLKLKYFPSAQVTHLFWSGGLYNLCKHFFNWAIGDSALFNRFEDSLVYPSYPNFVETWFIVVLPCTLAMNNNHIFRLFLVTVVMYVCDVAVDMFWKFGTEFKHRRSLLENDITTPFAIMWTPTESNVRNISRRFDWHCGRLEHSTRNFVQREKVKFLAFLVALISCSFKIKG